MSSYGVHFNDYNGMEHGVVTLKLDGFFERILMIKIF